MWDPNPLLVLSQLFSSTSSTSWEQFGDTKATGLLHPCGVNGFKFMRIIYKQTEQIRSRTWTRLKSEPNGCSCSCQHCKFNQLASHRLISNAFGSAVSTHFRSWRDDHVWRQEHRILVLLELKGHHSRSWSAHLILIESWELSHPLTRVRKISIFKESIWIYCTTMDNTINQLICTKVDRTQW